MDFPPLLSIIVPGLLIWICLTWVFHLVRSQKYRSQLGLDDLHESLLRQKEEEPRLKVPGTAVVCGGSLSGLLAARVCHAYFEKVIIIEPESWLSDNEKAVSLTPWSDQPVRSRLVQYHQTQTTQIYALITLRALFPSFDAAAATYDMRILPADYQSYASGRRIPVPTTFYSGKLPDGLFASRQGLETLIRRLVLDRKSYPNITQIAASVARLELGSQSGNVSKVGLSREGGGVEWIDASLIIDCTGPSQGGLKWLSQLGLGTKLRDSKLEYDSHGRASTFKFRVTPSLAERLPIPGGFSSAGPIYNCLIDAQHNIWTQRIENDILMICCGGWRNEKTPQDLSEIIEFAKELDAKLVVPLPEWFKQMLEMIREVEHTATLNYLRFPICYFNNYHLSKDIPNNFIAIGDSVSRVNPFYAQGCVKAIMGVVTLHQTLHRVSKSATPQLPNEFSKTFFKLQHKKIEPIWHYSKISDYGFKLTTPVSGEQLSRGSLLRWYLRKLNQIGMWDPEVASVIWHIKVFLAPPMDYFHPRLVGEVFYYWITRQC